jgi:hypothetical protein
MNGTSGFREVRSSTPRSLSRIGSRTSNCINSETVPESKKRFLTPFPLPSALSTGISTKRETVPDTLSASSLPDSTGRCFFDLKFKGFRFVWLITLIVVAGLGLASCVGTGSIWPYRGDQIHFIATGTAQPMKYQYGALIDGKRDGQCLNDYQQLPVDSGQDMYIGNFTSSSPPDAVAIAFAPDHGQLVPSFPWCGTEARDEIIGFTSGHPPTIRPVNWATGSDYVDLHFQKTYTFPVKVWIVSGDSTNQTNRAALALVMTEMIWHNERQGFAFGSVHIDDTKKDNSFARFTCDSFDNPDETKWITHDRIQERAINIYYVEEVISERNGGGYSDDNGFSCYMKEGHRNVIVMGSKTAPALLAHEFGHAFGIGHVSSFTEFDETNVMHEASDLRKYFTEGQTFRQVILPWSAVNDPNIYQEVLTMQGITPQTPRNCPVLRGLPTESGTSQDTIRKCPLLQTRIWPDGTPYPWGRWAQYPLKFLP